jgi:hypothetical protein
MKVTFFGLVALASAVLAQGDYFQIESPSKGTTLKAGEVLVFRHTLFTSRQLIALYL